MRRRSKKLGLPARRGMDPEWRDRGRECSEWLDALDELLEAEWVERLERDPLDDLERELLELALDDEPPRDLKV